MECSSLQARFASAYNKKAMPSLALIVLDGWGLRVERDFNAIAAARKPNFDRFWRKYPHATIRTSGEAVGLPKGQMGNSEVGHQNLGAGRVVLQDSARISKAIEDGNFFKNEVLLRTIEHAKSKKSRLHLMGLVSDGGVHSLIEHLFALLELTKRERVKDVFIHAFLDGRDTSPTGGVLFIKQLREQIESLGVGRIATLMGRYWAMDRDNRWERTEKAFRALREAHGLIEKNPAECAVERAYARGETDEFIKPIILDEDGRISDGDAVIFFNFRADRARQLTRAFIENSFDKFPRDGKPEIEFVSMTEYDDDFDTPVAFPSTHEVVRHTFGEVISEQGLKQLRIAETEKYAHVTYFFNNGHEEPFPGEDRRLIPSPKVATYDLKPEMSAFEVAEEAAKQISAKKHDFLLLNFANPDMVGHTGVFEAAVKAIESVDQALGTVMEAVLDVGGEALITADHGNAEIMKDKDGKPHTAHTSNPCPLIYVTERACELVDGGALCDIAPTMLKILDMKQPEEMRGRNLLKGME